MNLAEQLTSGHSRKVTDEIIAWIGDSKIRFKKLMDIFMGDDARLAQRAAWPMSYISVAQPKLITPYLKKLLEYLDDPTIHEAIRRNTMRLLQDINIPEDLHGEVMNRCFDIIQSVTYKPATKAFALTTLYNLSKQYPDIKQEIAAIIETSFPNESKAFQSRARKVMKRMRGDWEPTG